MRNGAHQNWSVSVRIQSHSLFRGGREGFFVKICHLIQWCYFGHCCSQTFKAGIKILDTLNLFKKRWGWSSFYIYFRIKSEKNRRFSKIYFRMTIVKFLIQLHLFLCKSKRQWNSKSISSTERQTARLDLWAFYLSFIE